MNKIITLAFGLLFVFTQAFSQGKLVYEEDSRWFWGLNLGTTWQTTDVKNQNDWGLGLTVGKSYNYNYGKKISFDIRGRYLYGNWYGQDVDTTGFGLPNAALSSGATNYKDSLGYSILNYRTSVHRLALELVIHFNGIRERTNWDPYIFGGVGLSWHQTYGNLLNSSDSLTTQLYDYNQLNGNYSKSGIRTLLDDTYETALNGSKAGSYRVGFMPSLGFGLGYQVGPRFSLGLEHKTTFTRIDDFDGYVNQGSAHPNDLYHYTSFYLRFQVRKRRPSSTDNTLQNVPNYDDNITQKPVVNFTNPAVSGSTVNQPNFNIRADVNFVFGKDDIQFRQNGNLITNFTYNASTDRLESNVVLNPGQNVFEIIGTNQYGSDQESTIIIYNRQEQPQVVEQLPIVNFTNPAVSGTTVSQAAFAIRADVFYVDGKSNITFRQNGNYNGNFTYNPATDKLESNVTLNPGQNVFEIVATNSVGTDQETTIIIFNREVKTPPVVTFTNPATSPYTTENQSFNMAATVLNVQQANQITVKVNGQNFTNFNFNPSTSAVNAVLNLNLGANVVTVTGTNNAGTDSETTTIIYKPGVVQQPPVVYFVDPQANPYTTMNGTFVINAEVLNVAGQQNVTFKQNGTVNSNFTFNASTNDFQSTVVLNPGQNVFEIIGTNNAGTAQATTIIIYERQAPRPPIVTITNPSFSPYTTENSVFALTSTVLNVSNASQIQVTLNGQNISNFTYTNSTNGVNAYLNLIEGSNTVSVRGTNNDGTDIKQTVLIYRKPVVPQPPVVTFTAPSMETTTTENPTYAVVASVLNVPTSAGINVNINGVNVTNFTFNPTTTTLTFPVSLIEGANVIVVTGTNTVGSDTKSRTIMYRKPQTVIPPVVTFQDPIQNPLTVFNQSYEVRARVQHVASAQNIQLKINGVVSTNFVYSNSSELMTFSTSLVVGANMIEITATNSAGQDIETTTIILRLPDPMLPPVVTITNPIANPSSSTQPAMPITATVLNVDGPQNIQVLVNGTSYTGFSFNTSTKQLTFTMNLNEGSNSLQINATNSAGQANDARTINYRKLITQNPPFVTFLNPSVAGSTVNVPNYTMKANVTNVDNSSQLVVQQNGQTLNPSSYSFNAATKEVTLVTSLNVGNNAFTVRGTNTAGTHAASTTISYRTIVCDKPTMSFVTPRVSEAVLSVNTYNYTVKIENIIDATQIQVLLNGVAQSGGTYNAATRIFGHTVTLADGQNTLELIATNNCGNTKLNRTMEYKEVKAPCLSPSLQRLLPTAEATQTQQATVEIKASAINVSAASQLVLLVNGVNKPFNYDPATKQVTATVGLNIGTNIIDLQASNDCGSAKISWSFTRRACEIPVITVLSATAPNNGNTIAQAFGLKGSVTGLSVGSNITVTQNGSPVNFVYNTNTNSLLLDRPLVMGVNTIVITATNECGTATLTYVVTRNADPNAVAPKINITNPATSPFNSDQAAMNIQISTQFVTAAGQVSVTVNGASTNFNFDASTGKITFNQTFVDGSNIIVATAVNNFGTATDTKVVNYRKQNSRAPKITMTNPTSYPATIPVGATVVTGTVSNIANLNEVTFTLNGRPLGNVNPVLNNGSLTFSVTLNMGEGSNPMILQINASNVGGSDSKTCVFNVASSKPVVKPSPVKPVVTPTPKPIGKPTPAPTRGR